MGSSSLEQSGYNSPFVGCGVVGRELEVLICVGGLMVDFSRERAIIIVHYLDVQKRYNMSFSLRCELDVVVDRRQDNAQ